jgi:catechol 2,3-dioxygenase-like lactoylglutathione lyase family enzyme
MAFDHINLVVKDLHVCRHFYETVLGMTITFEKHLSGPWFHQVTGIPGAEADCLFLEFPTGGCRLELLQFANNLEETVDSPSPSNPGFRHFALETEDMPGLRARLADAGCPAVSEPVEVPFEVGPEGKRKVLFYFRDPEGNLVEAASYL